jgi:hypothetical protein
VAFMPQGEVENAFARQLLRKKVLRNPSLFSQKYERNSALISPFEKPVSQHSSCRKKTRKFSMDKRKLRVLLNCGVEIHT